jgi:hypothetical protein
MRDDWAIPHIGASLVKVEETTRGAKNRHPTKLLSLRVSLTLEILFHFTLDTNPARSVESQHFQRFVDRHQSFSKV